MHTTSKLVKSKTKRPPKMRVSHVCIAEVVDQKLIAIGGILQPLTQRLLEKLIPNLQVLNEKFREKAVRKFFKTCKTGLEIHRKKPLWHVHPNRCTLDASPLLGVGNLFEVPSVGYGILALLVSSVGTKQLQAVALDFCPAVAIPQADQVAVNIFDTLTDAVVQRYHWKAGKTKIYRDPLLDCKGNGDFFITDYTYVQLKSKRSNPYCLPIPYTNSVVTVVGATTKQMTEIAPLVHAGTTFLLGCAKGEWDGVRYTAQDVGQYDPAVLQCLAEATAPTAQLLHLWRKELLKDERFAHRVVSKAKGSFGISDSRFVSVRIDPKALTLAIAYQMFLEFLNFLVNVDAASPELIALHRQGIQDALYPQPKAEVRLETPLEPTVFMAILKELLTQNGDIIIADEEAYPAKGRKLLGAWRTIGKERCLVMLEEVFVKAYVRACKKRGDLNCQCFDTRGWTLELQRALMEAGITKGSKGNPRYRYGLLTNKPKDDTYVLAVYASQLEEALPVQSPVQMDENPEIQFAQEVDLEEGEEI